MIFYVILDDTTQLIHKACPTQNEAHLVATEAARSGVSCYLFKVDLHPISREAICSMINGGASPETRVGGLWTPMKYYKPATSGRGYQATLLS